MKQCPISNSSSTSTTASNAKPFQSKYSLCHHLLIPASKSSTHINVKRTQALSNIPNNLDYPSPPNARFTAEETKKLFGFCASPVIDAVETSRSKIVESKNADAMPPPRRLVLYEVAAHSYLSHANVRMYTRNRRVDLLIDWSEKLRHVQGQVRHTIITPYITDTAQFLASFGTI
jgi:hypothetical protein